MERPDLVEAAPGGETAARRPPPNNALPFAGAVSVISSKARAEIEDSVLRRVPGGTMLMTATPQGLNRTGRLTMQVTLTLRLLFGTNYGHDVIDECLRDLLEMFQHASGRSHEATLITTWREYPDTLLRALDAHVGTMAFSAEQLMHQGFHISPESVDGDPINAHPHRCASSTVAAAIEQYNRAVDDSRAVRVQCDTRGVLRPLPTCDGLDVERVARAIAEPVAPACLDSFGVHRVETCEVLRRCLGVRALHVVDAETGGLTHDGGCLFAGDRALWIKRVTLLTRGTRPLTARLWYREDHGVSVTRLVACIDDAGDGRAFVYPDATYEEDERLLNAMADTVRFDTRKILESPKFNVFSWRFACLYLWIYREGQTPLNQLLLQPITALLDAVRPTLCATICRFDRLPAGCQHAYASRSTFDLMRPSAVEKPVKRKKKRRAALEHIDFNDRAIWETSGDERFGEHVDLNKSDASVGTIECMSRCVRGTNSAREALVKSSVKTMLLGMLILAPAH